MILKELRCESKRTSINDDQGLNDIGLRLEAVRPKRDRPVLADRKRCERLKINTMESLILAQDER